MISILDSIEANAFDNPTKKALVCGEESWTWQDLLDSSAQLARALTEKDIAAGDRLIAVLPSSFLLVTTMLAVFRLGATFVPLNPTAPLSDVQTIADLTGAKMVIYQDGAANFGSGPQSDNAGSDLPLRWIDSRSLGRLMAAQPDTDFPNNANSGPDFILFTSGTTGKPKGVPLTLAGLMDATKPVAAAISLRADDVVACPVPLFHVFGIVVGLFAPWSAGATVVISERFDPAAFMAMAGPTASMLLAVPTMLAAFVSAAKNSDTSGLFPELRAVLSGGSPMPDEIRDRFHDAFGVLPRLGYGMTETSGVISIPPLTGPSIGSGSPVASISLEIRPRPNTKDIDDGVGEIWVKGSHVITEYLYAPEENAKAFDDGGWFNTGDIGCLTEGGELVLVGRSKEIIIRGGLNVYPGEVEAILIQHPAVAAAVVAGTPHDQLGEEVGAYIKFADGYSATDPSELIDWCRSRLALYKYPRYVKVVDAVPTSPAGKVLRHLLPPLRETAE